jgi:hypothetical protein
MAFMAARNAQLVVDHHVVRGGVALLDGVEHLLLVHVDQHAALGGVPQARALHLARLEHHVAVGQDHRGPVAAQVLQGFQCAGVEPVGEGVVDEKARHQQQPRVAHAAAAFLGAVALQRAQVVDVAELAAQRSKAVQ